MEFQHLVQEKLILEKDHQIILLYVSLTDSRIGRDIYAHEYCKLNQLFYSTML